MHGEMMRKSLDVRNWESAQKIVRDWEARVEGSSVSVKEAFERYISDCEARKLSSETLRKYRLLEREMVERFGLRSVDSMGIEELSEYRESWNLSAVTVFSGVHKWPFGHAKPRDIHFLVQKCTRTSLSSRQSGFEHLRCSNGHSSK